MNNDDDTCNMNNDDDIIKIDINEFKKTLNEYNMELNKKSLMNYYEKKNALIENFNCFKDKYDSKFLWEKKKKKINNQIKTNKKIHTFTTISTDSNKDKKNFISLLNKLTNNNKNIIMNDINNIISNTEDFKELINVIFTNISKNYNELYIDILFLINEKNKDVIYDYYNNYINNNLWKLLNEYNNVNIMDDKNYELFCEYKKFKTKNKNIITSLLLFDKDKIIINNYIDILVDYILDIINVKSYVINYYLELLEIMKDNISIDNYNKLDNLNIVNYDKSTKFIYNNLYNNI